MHIAGILLRSKRRVPHGGWQEPETVSVKKAALTLGSYLGTDPIFEDDCGNDAYLNDASLAAEVFGYPAVSAKTLLRWQAEWILEGGRTLGKPTHFEERKGSY